MDVNHKDVMAVLPKKINDIGRIDGLKKWAGCDVDIVIANPPLMICTNDCAPIPMCDGADTILANNARADDYNPVTIIRKV